MIRYFLSPFIKYYYVVEFLLNPDPVHIRGTPKDIQEGINLQKKFQREWSGLFLYHVLMGSKPQKFLA